MHQGTELTFTVAATDPDDPPDAFSFSLDVGAPSGASVDSSTGVFSWMPTEAQDLGSYELTIRVADDNEPNLSTKETINITVVSRWHNPADPNDVDGQEPVTPLDVLTIINYINSHPQSSSLPGELGDAPPPYYDVNNDGLCTALDVLQVINCINSLPGGSGEAEAVVGRVSGFALESDGRPIDVIRWPSKAAGDSDSTHPEDHYPRFWDTVFTPTATNKRMTIGHASPPVTTEMIAFPGCSQLDRSPGSRTSSCSTEARTHRSDRELPGASVDNEAPIPSLDQSLDEFADLDDVLSEIAWDIATIRGSG